MALADAPQKSSPVEGTVQQAQEQAEKSEDRKKRVVILGSGWGATAVMQGLDTSLYETIIVSPRNYFLFTPLLPGVCVGTVEGRSISEAVRKMIVNAKSSAKYQEAEAISIDPKNQQVLCKDTSAISVTGKDSFALDYDYLVVAVGAETNTFGTPGVKEHAYFLKEIDDADKIREKVIDCFETACLPSTTEEEKRRLLHFIVVGGGPTGCEFAAELHDLVEEDLKRLYPECAPYTKVTLVQSADHILNTFDQRISDYATKHFLRSDINVKVSCRVINVTDRTLTIWDKWKKQKEELEFGVTVWATGIGTRPLVSDLMEKIGQSDRRALLTDEWLRVKGTQGIYAIGDCATVQQRSLVEDVTYLFKLADKDGDGKLTYDELAKVLSEVKERFPQVEHHLSKSGLRILLHDFAEDPSKITLDIDAFTKALSKIDSQVKALPATAQVASQEGTYLAKALNHMAERNIVPEGPMRIRGEGRHLCHPFRYKHFGQFTTLGGGEASVELPGDWVSSGRSTMWLWYSVYASKQVSWRTRCLVVMDWMKAALFGRDSSRM
ncbi:NADH-dehydrogenase [Klebsormidium nitens]|uniref:NADH:ubiquinone reductase (non-electrogenic) n=1 Tax=Klebsormidium nitens TaxID=105231 RepID=A0A1Y1IQQ7_KLENI|nr:NADH-dehydrogenase [Klebsormidium nitens]|eukprot:GAQ91581.1 NADH-dehydrogenase [Klebsormidium nitens]